MTTTTGMGAAAGLVRRETATLIVADGAAPTHVSELSWRGAAPRHRQA